jgi:opacity protein-like surface antigen
MKSRLIYFALILILTSSISFAQGTDNPRASIGILGGVNFQNFNGKDNSGNTLDNDMIIGYHAGVNIQVPIAPEFYFQPGLLFSVKGSKNDFGLLTGTYRLSYIEIPLNLVYKGLLGNGYVTLGFGPYIGYGIAGNSKIESGSVTIETDVEFTSVVETGDPLTTSHFRPFDAGGNIFFGYEMVGGLFLQLNAQLGLLKINPEDRRLVEIYSDELSVKNTGFGLSVGYRF